MPTTAVLPEDSIPEDTIPADDSIPEAAPAQPGQPDIGMAQGTPAQMGYVMPGMVGQAASDAAGAMTRQAMDTLGNHVPEITASLATLPFGGMGGWGGFGTRLAAGTLGGFAGKMFDEMDRSEDPNVDFGKITLESAKSGAFQGIAGSVGEGAIWLGFKGIPKAVVGVAEKTPLGRLALEKIGMGVRKEAMATAQQMADQVAARLEPAAIGGVTEQGINDYTRISWLKQNSLASKAALGATGHTLEPDGAMAIADMIKGAFSKDEFARKTGNFMEPLAQIDQKVLDTWLGAKEGNQELYKIIRAVGEDKGKVVAASRSQDKIVAMMESLDPDGIYHDIITEAAKNGKIPVALAINFRKAVSQIAADKTAPQALQRVAASIQDNGGKRLQDLDTLITKSLPPEAAADYMSYLEFSAAHGKIIDNAAYNIMKRDPNAAVEAIVPQRPDTVAAVRFINDTLVKNNRPEIMPFLQRGWMEKQMQTKGIEGFNDAVKAYGPEVVNGLFPRGTPGATALKTVSDLSSDVTRKLTDLGVQGEMAREGMDKIIAHIGATTFNTALGGAAGYGIGAATGDKRTGSALGGVVGMVIPYVAVLAARGNGPAIQTLKGFANFATNSPAVNDIIGRRLANYLKEASENPVSAGIASAMERKHTNIK